MASRVTIRDRGADKLLSAVKNRIGIRVGIIGREHAEIAMIAAIHERGTSRAGRTRSVIIPRRSWLGDYIDGNRATLRRRMRGIAERSIGAGGARSAFMRYSNRFGALAVGEIQARISAGIMPANAQSTIDRKRSSKPLIDRGIMRASITWVAEVRHAL